MFKVLIIEAQQVAADAFVRYIERLEGFTIMGQASNGADALYRLSTEQLDLVLLDVYLPDMSGLDLLRRIRAAGNRVDVIAVTRARDLSAVQAAVTFGAMQYLMKPFTFAMVRQKLEGYQTYRSKLATKPTIGQHDIDHLLYALHGLTADVLPKGISAESLEAVVTALREAGGGIRMSAVEIARISGMSRVTARRYLEYLVESGRAERTARYRGAGRPEFEYRLVPAADRVAMRPDDPLRLLSPIPTSHASATPGSGDLWSNSMSAGDEPEVGEAVAPRGQTA